MADKEAPPATSTASYIPRLKDARISRKTARCLHFTSRIAAEQTDKGKTMNIAGMPVELTALLLLVSVVTMTSLNHAAKRVALLVGNASYATANPIRDARLLARVPKNDLGFDVDLPENADRARLIELVEQFPRYHG